MRKEGTMRFRPLDIISVLVLSACCWADAQMSSAPEQAARDTLVGNLQIDPSVLASFNALSNRAAQTAYLLDLVGGEVSTDKANAEKTAALFLLGRLGGTNSIDVLLRNLTFKDAKTKISPAVLALASIGEPAVEPIFQFIQQADDQLAAVRGAEAIQMIKCRDADCSDYFNWLKPRFSSLPKHLQDALAVVDY